MVTLLLVAVHAAVFCSCAKGWTPKLAAEAAGAEPVWHRGYRHDAFQVEGYAGTLIKPHEAAPGNPWIWRTEFLGAWPQADLVLLAKGFHVGYLNIQQQYGSPAAVRRMAAFYDYLTDRYKLDPKPVLEGFSRGGLYAFNFAAAHPSRVAGLYVDAPVCDMRSWPGGRGSGVGSPADWQGVLRNFHVTEEQALRDPINPIDHLRPLADARIPILAVCGDADDVVPYTENTGVVEQRYKALGGDIEVIIKRGVGHHPHSLEDPTPIVDFVLKVTGQRAAR